MKNAKLTDKERKIIAVEYEKHKHDAEEWALNKDAKRVKARLLAPNKSKEG